MNSESAPIGRIKRKKTRVYKQDEEEEQGGMNTWENIVWEPYLDAKPKSPEPYSNGDRWINWKPQERIRGEAKEKDTGSAAAVVAKEPSEDSESPLNEYEHKACQQYLDGYYERHPNSPDPRTLSTEEQRSLSQRMSPRLCPTTVKRKRGSPHKPLSKTLLRGGRRERKKRRRSKRRQTAICI